MLIGSSDTGNTAAADVGRLKVTIAGNYFRKCPAARAARAFRPRARLQQLTSSATSPPTPIRTPTASAWARAGRSSTPTSSPSPAPQQATARHPADPERRCGQLLQDAGSVLNAVLGARPVSSNATWTPPLCLHGQACRIGQGQRWRRRARASSAAASPAAAIPAQRRAPGAEAAGATGVCIPTPACPSPLTAPRCWAAPASCACSAATARWWTASMSRPRPPAPTPDPHPPHES